MSSPPVCTAQWLLHRSASQTEDPQRVLRMKVGVVVLGLLAHTVSAFLVPTWQVARDAPSRRDQHARDLDVELENLLKGNTFFLTKSASFLWFRFSMLFLKDKYLCTNYKNTYDPIQQMNCIQTKTISFLHFQRERGKQRKM